MDHRSPAFEATLLYTQTQLPEVDALHTRIEDILADQGELLVSFERIDQIYYLITCEHAKVLLALGNEALPLDGFLDAARPPTGSLHDSEILRRLTAIQSSTTVIVLPRDATAQSIPPAYQAVLRAICWEVVACLFDTASAELVFWAENETLFAAEEFEFACAYSAQKGGVETRAMLPPPCAKTPPRMAEPDISAQAQAWLNGASKDEVLAKPAAASLLQRVSAIAHVATESLARLPRASSFF